jgi:hypothetical protein
MLVHEMRVLLARMVFTVTTVNPSQVYMMCRWVIWNNVRSLDTLADGTIKGIKVDLVPEDHSWRRASGWERMCKGKIHVRKTINAARRATIRI